ncbi:hypothetical protein M885DRAFT_619664 [Pelagophyceae sp. CCMP2097]|nr:hypothetical protein M885DRAFT_619664 [Pelagophyceae sp. CCMP2097]
MSFAFGAAAAPAAGGFGGFGAAAPAAAPAFSFGGAAAAPAAAPAAAFSFGGGAAPAPGPAAAFGFGGAPAAATAAPAAAAPAAFSFGGAAPAAPAFGGAAAPAFGAAAAPAPAAFGGFGAAAAAPPAVAAAPAFGAAAPAATSAFSFGGAPAAAAPAFGAAVPAPALGFGAALAVAAPAPTTPAFGGFGSAAPVATPSAFGAAAPVPATHAFGGFGGAPAAATTPAFGAAAPATPAATPAFSFGGAAPAAAAPAFVAPAAPAVEPAASAFSFGGAAPAAAAPLFCAPAAAAPLFGALPAAAPAAAASAPSFGGATEPATAPLFGVPAPAPAAGLSFGAPAAADAAPAAAVGFGAAAAEAAPASALSFGAAPALAAPSTALTLAPSTALTVVGAKGAFDGGRFKALSGAAARLFGGDDAQSALEWLEAAPGARRPAAAAVAAALCKPLADAVPSAAARRQPRRLEAVEEALRGCALGAAHWDLAGFGDEAVAALARGVAAVAALARVSDDAALDALVATLVDGPAADAVQPSQLGALSTVFSAHAWVGGARLRSLRGAEAYVRAAAGDDGDVSAAVAAALGCGFALGLVRAGCAGDCAPEAALADASEALDALEQPYSEADRRDVAARLVAARREFGARAMRCAAAALAAGGGPTALAPAGCAAAVLHEASRGALAARLEAADLPYAFDAAVAAALRADSDGVDDALVARCRRAATAALGAGPLPGAVTNSFAFGALLLARQRASPDELHLGAAAGGFVALRALEQPHAAALGLGVLARALRREDAFVVRHVGGGGALALASGDGHCVVRLELAAELAARFLRPAGAPVETGGDEARCVGRLVEQAARVFPYAAAPLLHLGGARALGEAVGGCDFCAVPVGARFAVQLDGAAGGRAPTLLRARGAAGAVALEWCAFVDADDDCVFELEAGKMLRALSGAKFSAASLRAGVVLVLQRPALLHGAVALPRGARGCVAYVSGGADDDDADDAAIVARWSHSFDAADVALALMEMDGADAAAAASFVAAHCESDAGPSAAVDALAAFCIRNVHRSDDAAVANSLDDALDAIRRRVAAGCASSAWVPDDEAQATTALVTVDAGAALLRCPARRDVGGLAAWRAAEAVLSARQGLRVLERRAGVELAVAYAAAARDFQLVEHRAPQRYAPAAPAPAACLDAVVVAVATLAARRLGDALKARSLDAARAVDEARVLMSALLEISQRCPAASPSSPGVVATRQALDAVRVAVERALAAPLAVAAELRPGGAVSCTESQSPALLRPAVAALAAAARDAARLAVELVGGDAGLAAALLCGGGARPTADAVADALRARCGARAPLAPLALALAYVAGGSSVPADLRLAATDLLACGARLAPADAVARALEPLVCDGFSRATPACAAAADRLASPRAAPLRCAAALLEAKTPLAEAVLDHRATYADAISAALDVAAGVDRATSAADRTAAVAAALDVSLKLALPQADGAAFWARCAAVITTWSDEAAAGEPLTAGHVSAVALALEALAAGVNRGDAAARDALLGAATESLHFDDALRNLATVRDVVAAPWCSATQHDGDGDFFDAAASAMKAASIARAADAAVPAVGAAAQRAFEACAAANAACAVALAAFRVLGAWARALESLAAGAADRRDADVAGFAALAAAEALREVAAAATASLEPRLISRGGAAACAAVAAAAQLRRLRGAFVDGAVVADVADAAEALSAVPRAEGLRLAALEAALSVAAALEPGRVCAASFAGARKLCRAATDALARPGSLGVERAAQALLATLLRWARASPGAWSGDIATDALRCDAPRHALGAWARASAEAAHLIAAASAPEATGSAPPDGAAEASARVALAAAASSMRSSLALALQCALDVALARDVEQLGFFAQLSRDAAFAFVALTDGAAAARRVGAAQRVALLEAWRLALRVGAALVAVLGTDAARDVDLALGGDGRVGRRCAERCARFVSAARHALLLPLRAHTLRLGTVRLAADVAALLAALAADAQTWRAVDARACDDCTTAARGLVRDVSLLLGGPSADGSTDLAPWDPAVKLAPPRAASLLLDFAAAAEDAAPQCGYAPHSSQTPPAGDVAPTRAAPDEAKLRAALQSALLPALLLARRIELSRAGDALLERTVAAPPQLRVPDGHRVVARPPQPCDTAASRTNAVVVASHDSGEYDVVFDDEAKVHRIAAAKVLAVADAPRAGATDFEALPLSDVLVGDVRDSPGAWEVPPAAGHLDLVVRAAAAAGGDDARLAACADVAAALLVAAALQDDRAAGPHHANQADSLRRAGVREAVAQLLGPDSRVDSALCAALRAAAAPLLQKAKRDAAERTYQRAPTSRRAARGPRKW